MLHPVASTMDEGLDEWPDKENAFTQTSEPNAANCTYGPVALVWKDHEQVERNVSKISISLYNELAMLCYPTGGEF